MKKTTNDRTFELMEMLFAISRRMRGEMSYTNSFIHLSIVQIQTLIFLHHCKTKNATMSDIAEYFHIELPSATSLVNKLCAQKLVARHGDSEDRRLVIITLTAEGKKCMEEAMNHRRKKLEKMLSYVSAEEKSQLISILKTLSTKLVT